MNRCALAFAVAAALASASPARADTLATVGKPAPKFDLATPSGGELTLASFARKPLVLNVFASWCPPCREELPRIVSAARSHAATVAFLGVDAQEPVAMATAFARQMHLPYPIALDRGQFAASYGAAALPETIFVDRAGIVRAIVRGPVSSDVLAKDLALVGAAAQ